MRIRSKKKSNPIQENLQKQVTDLGLSLIYIIQAADLLAQNQTATVQKIEDLNQRLANTEEELRILRAQYGA